MSLSPVATGHHCLKISCKGITFLLKSKGDTYFSIFSAVQEPQEGILTAVTPLHSNTAKANYDEGRIANRIKGTT